MINLPKIIDTFDILINEDIDGINKIAAKISNDTDIETELEDMPNEKFAAVIRNGEELLKKFPINTKTNTELSILALEHTNENLPDEIVKTAASNLIKAAYLWGIDASSIKTLAGSGQKGNLINTNTINKKAYLEKVATEETPDHTVFALGDKYPIDSLPLLKTAEEYFSKFGNHFNIMDKFEFAKNMLKQAEALNYKVTNDGITKYSHLRYEKNPDLETILKARDRWGDTDGIYTEIAKKASKLPLEKLAEVIFEADEATGLSEYYGTKIPDPVFTVFASIEKKAQKRFTKKALSEIPDTKLQSIGLNDDAIKELRGPNSNDVLNSLPDPIMSQLIDLL